MRYVIAAMVIAGATAADARPRPGTIYAALFRPGARWRYRVTERARAGAMRSAVHSNATCEVVEVRAYPGGVMARIDCDAHSALPIAGVWIEDVRGLWRMDEFPRDVPDLREAQLVIDAAPAARCARHELGDVIDIEQSVCFGARGITSASSGSQDAGSSTEIELR